MKVKCSTEVISNLIGKEVIAIVKLNTLGFKTELKLHWFRKDFLL